MTTYFDTFQTALHKEGTGSDYRWDILADMEQALVFDVTVAAMQVEFPEDLRRAVHAAVFRNGVTTLPDNAIPRAFEHKEEHLRHLRNLGSDLHEVFHAVAYRCPQMGDGPRTWINQYFTRGEEERENMVVCGCTHRRMKHSFDHPSVCEVEGCECKGWNPQPVSPGGTS